MAAPQLVEPRRHAGNRTRCDADRVVDELVPERHVQHDELRIDSLRTEPRYRDEAVEVPRPPRGGVEVDRVSAAEQPGHHRLGHARREAGGDRAVGGASALREDLHAGLRRRRVTGRDRGSHGRRLVGRPVGG